MLKNMKIKKSLILGFGITVAVLVVMSTSLLLLVGDQRRSYNSIIQHQIRANQLITICRMNAETAARNVRDMALRPGDRSNSTLEAHANEVLAELKTDLTELEKIYPLSDRTMLDNYVQAVSDWSSALPEIIDTVNDGDADHATTLIKNTCTPRLETMSDYAAVLDRALTEAQDEATTSQARTTIIIEAILITINVIAMLFIISMARKLINSIVEPAEQVRHALTGFSEGDFSIAVSYESKNELGEMCDALRTSQRILTAAVTDQCRLLEEMARGNFDIRSADASVYVGGLKSVLQSVRVINSNLSDTLAQIDLSAEQVSAGSEQVSTGAQALAQGATQQASAVEELSATIAEISNSAQKNAENSKSAMEHSLNAGARVDESSKYMEEMVQAMADISESSQEIGKIIATIENIAFQTNILALNAAVEAARAGSAGKGFAVVADEVRNLATKSDQAAKATKELIDRSIASVQNGNGIVKKVSESLSRTVEAAEQATGLIQLISKAAEEEAEAIAQVTEGIDQISSVVQTNSATSEQSAAASEELSSQASLMKELMAKFKLRTADEGYGSAPAAIPAALSGGEERSGGYANSFSKY